jgi:hypothetical protein
MLCDFHSNFSIFHPTNGLTDDKVRCIFHPNFETYTQNPEQLKQSSHKFQHPAYYIVQTSSILHCSNILNKQATTIHSSVQSYFITAYITRHPTNTQRTVKKQVHLLDHIVHLLLQCFALLLVDILIIPRINFFPFIELFCPV